MPGDAPKQSWKPESHLKEADHWGEGATRRRIHLTGSAGQVVATIGDHNHSMRCTLRHDGQVVTAAEPEFRRVTLNHCAGAAVPLAEIIGMPIAITPAEFFAGGRARRNCTHMLDLAWLAMRHACRPHGTRSYAIDIPDSTDGNLTGELRRDGEVVLCWESEGQTIVSPERFAGQSLAGGIVSWIVNRSGLEGDELEAALVLHKGFFMVPSRQYRLVPGPISDVERPLVTGACYGFAAERIGEAVRRADLFHDFSERADELLRFD